jgi:hypothetical protein
MLDIPARESTVEELTDVDKPSKGRQKVLPVDCTAALGKANNSCTI